ncbi:hypothetical protein D3C83_275330 [compost metagenome]
MAAPPSIEAETTPYELLSFCGRRSSLLMKPMLSCASRVRCSCERRFVRMFIRWSPLLGTTFCSFWYSLEMK